MPPSRYLGAAAVAALLSSVVNAQAGPIEEIVVTADGSQVTLPDPYAGGQVARGGRFGLLGNLDMMDVPFTATAYTEQLMRDQQSRSVADVLQNDPVVRVAKGFGNFQELYVIRGFPVFSDDMTYNGLYGILPRQYVAAELLERVEVFRGANSFLNGAAPGGSGVGGAFNLVPKRAPAEPLTRLTVGFESDALPHAALDAGRRFGAADAVGVRVNLLHRDGETAVDGQDRTLTAAALGTDYQGERLRLAADVGYQDHRIDAPRPSVTPLGEIPDPADADANFAQPWTYTDEEQLFGVVRAEYDLNPSVTVWAAAGGRSGEERNVLSNPSAFADGSTTAYRFDNAREDTIFSADAGLRGDFRTGAVGHTVTLSASTISIESDNAYAFSSFAGFAGDLYDPKDVTAPAPDFFVGGDLSAPGKTEDVRNRSLALADMVSLLDDRLLLTLGLRYQEIDTRTYDYDSGAELSRYDESRVTPVAGAVLRFGERWSVYGNYAEGLVPGETAPAASGGVPIVNAGETFDPYQAEQYELGVKFDGGSLGASAALFSLSRPSSLVENNVFSADGEQRNRGLELSAFGEPLAGFRVLGGLTWLDAELTATQGGVNQGNDAVGVPELQASVNLEWDLPAVPGLTVDGRLVHTGEQYADAANTVRVDDWTRLDVGVRYATRLFDRAATLRARLENVTGEDYWASVGGFPGSNYLVLGTPRTLLLSATVDF